MSMPLAYECVRSTLEKLETALLTPVVSGELETWVKTVQENADELAPELREYIARIHRESFAIIAREDNELLGRVQDMKSTDLCNLAAFDLWRSRLPGLDTKAERVEPDEARISTRLDQFVESGLGCIREFRRQEAALQTWMNEAFLRDRGVGD